MIRTLAIMIFASLLLLGCSQRPEPKLEPLNIEVAIELTDDEKQFIKDHPVITWAAEQRPPVLYTTEDGTMAGRVPTYLEITSKATGLIFKPVGVGSLTEGLGAVKDGRIDLITSVRPTSERLDYLGFSAPFADSKAVFIFRIGNLPMVPLRAGVLKGDAARGYLITQFPNIQVVETVDNTEAIELLRKGLVDVAIMHEASADYIIEKQRLRLYKVQTNFVYQSSFGFRKEDALLGSILSKVILAISIEDKRRINQAWRKR